MYSEKTFTKGYIYTVFIHVVYQYRVYTTVYNIHVHIYKQTSDTHINVMKKKLHAWF